MLTIQFFFWFIYFCSLFVWQAAILFNCLIIFQYLLATINILYFYYFMYFKYPVRILRCEIKFIKMYTKNYKIQNKNFTSIISLKLCSNKMSKKNFKNCKIHRIFYKFIHQMKAVFRTIICIFSPEQTTAD